QGGAHPAGQDPGVGGDDAQADGPGEHADRGHQAVTQERCAEAERQDGQDEGAAAPPGGGCTGGGDVLGEGRRGGLADGGAHLATSSRLRILPVEVIGRVSTNSTMRGYL